MKTSSKVKNKYYNKIFKQHTFKLENEKSFKVKYFY